MQAVANSFDGIIDTVSAQHDISQLLPLLKVGHPELSLARAGSLGKQQPASPHQCCLAGVIRTRPRWCCRVDVCRKAGSGYVNTASAHCAPSCCRPTGASFCLEYPQHPTPLQLAPSYSRGIIPVTDRLWAHALHVPVLRSQRQYLQSA